MKQLPVASAGRNRERAARGAARAGAGCGVLLAAGLLLGGCQSAKVAHPLTAELSGNDPQTQLDFWHTLADRPVTSNDEAFHALLLYVDNNDPAGSYDDRVALLKSRKMLPPGFKAPAERAVSRGDLAVAICRIAEIRGGIMMHLTGGQWPRYAVRELEFSDVFPASSPNQTFSGMEFVGIIGRLEDYQRGNPARVPATILPGEMKPAGRPAAATQPARPEAIATQPQVNATQPAKP